MSRPGFTLPPPHSCKGWQVLVLLAVTLLVRLAPACTIPVFRYALDRWPADPFHLVIPSSVAKDPAIAKLLIPLRGNGPANLKIEENPAATEAKLIAGTEAGGTVWKGALDQNSLPALLDSPARREIIGRILAGESVIWVIVAGKKDGDKVAAERITKRLRYLEQVVALPPQDPNDPDSQLGPGPELRLKLTSITVSPEDPQEKLLCSMLAGKKCAEALAKGEPFAAPVFGRGRVLGAWPLAELDEAAIEDITMFLTGRCSCRVKNQSPGWDVLLQVDWESALEKAKPAGGKPAAAAAPAASRELEVITSTPVQESPDDDDFTVNSVTFTVEKFTWGEIAAGTAVFGAVMSAAILWMRR